MDKRNTEEQLTKTTATTGSKQEFSKRLKVGHPLEKQKNESIIRGGKQ